MNSPALILSKNSGISQARKKSTKINFLGPETAWWGGLPREGVVAEKCPPSKVCLPWVSRRGIWDVRRTATQRSKNPEGPKIKKFEISIEIANFDRE